MFNPMLMMLNQQLGQAIALGQQGMMAETAGNPQYAAQCYDQSIVLIQQSMMGAQQIGMPVPPHVHFALGQAHFCAARAKNAMGWAPLALGHLSYALGAINLAISAGPYVPDYHAFAGMVLLAQGNVAEAQRALTTALQLQPVNPPVQYLLSMVYAAQGNSAIAQQHYSAVQGMMPAGPPMPAPPAGIAGSPGRAWGASGAAAPTDWLKTIDQVLGAAQAVFKTIGGFNDMMKTFDS
ncbi:MAG TPA: tetratricopeptide repeat protein [Burkholderiaceae bacterium]|nr:tetratricopeptide repeat protein [Burkholderiaceae bacterium]